MINGLGVLGYGVGGIEAEAVLLGQPLYQPMPHVVGVRLTGALPRGSTATDLVLVVTEMLRTHGVVGAFVEFAGDGLAGLSLADRATISNMSPEFGATATLFPIDEETLTYLRLTGRSPERVDLVERYAKAQGLWRLPGDGPSFDETLVLDLGSVAPSLAGPRRPQDRVLLEDLPANFNEAFPAMTTSPDGVTVAVGGSTATIRHGSVAIAAITSCTNTSNPTVMIGAGLLARNAVARGLGVSPSVKTSLAPGSRAVTGYLETAGLMAPLEALGFALAGYGCTTCIGNSGPLDEAVAGAIEANDLVVAAVLSGNRNFEGRIHPLARASYLASPPLVVAFALAGRVDTDLTTEPLGFDTTGEPVFLADIWPSSEEIRSVIGIVDRPRALPLDVRDGLRRRRSMASVADPVGRPVCLGGRLHLHRQAAVLRRPRVRGGAAPGHRGRPGPGRPRRLGHDRPHLAGRIDRADITGRAVAAGPRRGAAGVQLVWRPPRPARGDDARHVRQHPAAERAGRRTGGPVHRPPAGWRAWLHLRRRDALRDRRRSARRAGRPGVRLGLVARLGRQGTGPARREGGDRRVVRAHPSIEPGRHGHPAAPVRAGRQCRVARPDRPRVVLDPGTGGRVVAAPVRHGDRPRRGRRRATLHRRSPGWTVRSTWSTTPPAGSCRPSCAAWRPSTERARGTPTSRPTTAGPCGTACARPSAGRWSAETRPCG